MKKLPRTLDQAIKACEDLFSEEQKQEIKSLPENRMVDFHHTAGRFIRNEWGLWSKGPLYRYLNEMGLEHPDDMSSVILTSFYKKLKNQPLQIKEQTMFYRAYWVIARTIAFFKKLKE